MGHGCRSTPPFFIFFIFFIVGQPCKSVSDELASEEPVSEINLSGDVDQAEKFAKTESQSVGLVAVKVPGEEVDQQLLTFVLLVFGNNGTAEVHDQHLHLATFVQRPQILRNVETNSLEAQHVADPLVEAVVFEIFRFCGSSSNTSMCSPFLAHKIRVHHVQGDESGLNETVVVDVRLWYRRLICDTVHRSAQELAGRQQQREQDQHLDRKSIQITRRTASVHWFMGQKNFQRFEQ